MVTLRRLSFLGIVALLALALPARSAEVDKFLPDKADTVLTINVKQLLHGTLVKKYAREPLQQALKDCGGVQSVLQAMGINPFQDIDRVVAAVAFDVDKVHEVIIIHGRFDTGTFQDGLSALAKENQESLKVRNEGEHRFYEIDCFPLYSRRVILGRPEAHRSGLVFSYFLPWEELGIARSYFFGLVDKGTVVISSDKQGMRDAFGRAAGSKKPSLTKWMRHAIEDTDAKQTLWLVMGPVPPLTKDAASGEEAQEDEEPDLVDRAKGGIRVADDITAHFTFTGVSIDAAKEMMDDLRDLRTRAEGFAMLYAGNQKECACLKDIPKAFKATRKGKTITVEGQLDADLLEQLVGLLQKAE